MRRKIVAESLALLPIAIVIAIAIISVAPRAGSFTLGAPTAGQQITSLLVDPASQRLFAASTSAATAPGYISTFDLRADRLISTVAVGRGFITLALERHAQRLYVIATGIASNDATISVLDFRNGALIGTLPAQPSASSGAVDEMTRRLFVLSANGTAVSIFDTNRQTLDVTGTAGLNDYSGVNPQRLAVDDATSRVFIANGSEGSVSVLNARTGRTLRTAKVRGFPGAVAVSAKTRRVFVANYLDRSVSLLDARTGRVLRTAALAAAPMSLAVDASHSQVIAATAPANGQQNLGSIIVLDATTGALVRSTTIPGTIVALAIDSRHQRAFALNSVYTRAGTHYRLSRFAGVVDLHSGRLLRSIAVGAESQCIAVDEQTGALFVSGPVSADTAGGNLLETLLARLRQPFASARQNASRDVATIVSMHLP